MKYKTIRCAVIICLAGGAFCSLFSQSNLSIHGYLSQAYAVSDGYQVFGIPEEGTWDYRTLALQFRYDADSKNSMIVQFSHRRLGKSPVMEFEEDVLLDWAFFEHRFSDNFHIKAGKILIPFGIYNEVRDVGILLPFFQVPFTPYSQGIYLSETVNGALLSYRLTSLDPWHFNFDFYAGNWNLIGWFNLKNPVSSNPITLVAESDVKDGYGGRLLVQTPIEGLALGSSFQSGHFCGGLLFTRDYDGIGEQHAKLLNWFIDADFERIFFRPEFTTIFFSPGKFNISGISGTAGFRITEKMSLNVSTEKIWLRGIPRYESPVSDVIRERRNSDYLQDLAAGFFYRPASFVVIKTEIHFMKGLFQEDVHMDVFNGAPRSTKYLVVSLSTSF